MVELFNFFYFMFIAFGIGMVIAVYFPLRNKSQKICKTVLFLILLSNFALHFLKLFADHYAQWMPYAIRTITPENICAVSVLIFPWLFLSKNRILKDYMFYMGVISGLAANLFPVDTIGYSAFAFETLRFHYSHTILWTVPMLMVMLKVHTLDYKRIPKVIPLAFVTLVIILVNEIILIGTGFVHINHLFSTEIRNSALIFGPLSDVGAVGALFTSLTPSLFLTVPVGPNAGALFHWPIFWLAIPFYIYATIASFLVALPFEHRRVRKDITALKMRLRDFYRTFR